MTNICWDKHMFCLNKKLVAVPASDGTSGGVNVPCIYTHARWELTVGDSGLSCCTCVMYFRCYLTPLLVDSWFQRAWRARWFGWLEHPVELVKRWSIDWRLQDADLCFLLAGLRNLRESRSSVCVSVASGDSLVALTLSLRQCLCECGKWRQLTGFNPFTAAVFVWVWQVETA